MIRDSLDEAPIGLSPVDVVNTMTSAFVEAEVAFVPQRALT